MGKIIIMVGLILSLAAPLRAEWPEQNLTLISGLPPTLPWSTDSAYQANPQALILESLVPRLSRELGVPVTLVSRPQGRGVLAANQVAGAKPDGYLLGVLDADAALLRVMLGYTPYTRAEIAPAATAWRMYPALVVRADLAAADLAGLARLDPPPRLAHTSLADSQGAEAARNAGRGPTSGSLLPLASSRPGTGLPLDTPTYLALSVARAAGFSWRMVQVERLDPALLLEGRAEALVLPLGWLERHPQAGRFKVLTILTHDEDPPCGQGRPTLASQGLSRLVEEPLLAFYLPAKVNWRARSRILSAINNSLRQPAVARSISEACLKVYIEDLDGAAAAMSQAYKNLESDLAVQSGQAAPERPR